MQRLWIKESSTEGEAEAPENGERGVDESASEEVQDENQKVC